MAQTNKKFAETDEVFGVACQLAGIPVTVRQASKWQNGKGKALKFKSAAIQTVQKKAEK